VCVIDDSRGLLSIDGLDRNESPSWPRSQGSRFPGARRRLRRTPRRGTAIWIDLNLSRVGAEQLWLTPMLYWIAWMSRRLVFGIAHAHIVVGGLPARASLRASTRELAGHRMASIASRMITVVPVAIATARRNRRGRAE